jgi:hypothetical protein
MKILRIILVLWILTSWNFAQAEPSDKVIEFINKLEEISKKGNVVADFHLGNIYMVIRFRLELIAVRPEFRRGKSSQTLFIF